MATQSISQCDVIKIHRHKGCQNYNHSSNQNVQDNLTKAEVKKVRKKGSKDGTPCQFARCSCDDYDPPPGIAQTSWLAMCNQCKHSETEHRLLTKFDKLVRDLREDADEFPCIGCDVMCKGFEKADDSIPANTPKATKSKCVTCRHVIDCHRPETEVDNYIQSMINAGSSKPCHVVLDGKDSNGTTKQQAYTSNVVDVEADDTKVLPYFEPVNVDSDELAELQWMNKQCRCRGFSCNGGDLAKVFLNYYGLTKEIVTPYIPYLVCHQCNHVLIKHREANDKENKLLEQKKKHHMTLTGVKSILTTISSPSQDAVAMHIMNDSTDNLLKIALARVECQTDAGYTVLATIIPIDQDDIDTQSKEMSGGHDGTTKKKRKMEAILDGVKQRIKKKKTGGDSSSAESESSMETDQVTTRPPCHAKAVNSALMQCLQEIDEPQYSMPIDCGISEPTCLLWSTSIAAEDAEVSFKDDYVLTLAIGSLDGTIVVFNCREVPDFHCLATVSHVESKSPVKRLAWSPDNTTLFSGHIDGTVALWNCSLFTCELVKSKEVRERTETVTALAANKRFLAIGYQNGDVIFYELLSEEWEDYDHPILVPKLTTVSSIAYGAVTCMTWHPEKSIVACGGEDDNISVFYFHTTDGQRRGSIRQYFSPRRHKKPNQFYKCCILKGHTSFVSSVNFDPSSQFLFSTGWDGQLFFWDTTEIDDVISSGDDETEVVFKSGFAIGQGQRSQGSTKWYGEPEGASPYVPIQATVCQGSVMVTTRCCQERVHIVLYEVPKSLSMEKDTE